MKLRFVIVLFVFIVPVSVLAQTGDIEGTVYRQGTGKLLAGADVRITETGQTQKTDENGAFQFTELPEGTYTFVVTHPLETTPTSISVAISSGDTTEIKMYLGEAVKLETIVVEGKRLPPTISRTEIRGSELLRIPGAANDALKGLTTLPSIGIPNDYFGVLYIRGSEPGSNLYYLDRTPLGYPFHWGGLLSTISSETIERIDIYAGGYGAEFGLDSQAVLDIHARDSIDERFDGKFNLNILYSEGLLEGRIGDNGYISVSGRRSYFDFIVGPIIESQTGSEQQFPYFSDYQLKFAYPLTEKHHLTLNAFAATDHFDFKEGEIEDDIDAHLERATFYFKNGFNGQGIHLHSNFTDNFTSHFSFTRAFNFLNVDLKDPDVVSYELENGDFKLEDGKLVAEEIIYNSYDVKVKVPVYTLREGVSYKFTSTLQFEVGSLLSFSPANSFEDSNIYEYEPVGEDIEISVPIVENGEVIGESVTRRPARYEVTELEETHYEFGHDFYRTEGYLQARYDPLSFLSIALGTRLDYLNLTEQLSVQPRGSISLKLRSGFNLRFAYGHYEQSPKPYQILSENGNADLESSLTRHYIMEIEHELTDQTEFKFATYYKDSQKLVTEDEVSTPSEGQPTSTGGRLATEAQISNYLNQGSAYVGGVEAFLRHRIPDKFFGWISYAYTHAEQRDYPKAAYQPYLFDNTHILSIVANYNFSANFEIGAKWQYLSGTSAVPISSLVLIQDPLTRGLNPLLASVDEELTAELTPYHKLDFRISRKWNVRGMKIGGFLDVLNVYNRKNTVKFSFKEATIEVQGEEVEIEAWESEEVSQLPRIIYVGLTLEF
ncbi:MAG: carboxypeptidase-like regulatory domain-containing protein [Candidatus Poribacteria bacterium]|nr:carboxypeptidase-like regulatory domain-containing protein [Candidatus Poribacteria bacterium]